MELKIVKYDLMRLDCFVAEEYGQHVITFLHLGLVHGQGQDLASLDFLLDDPRAESLGIFLGVSIGKGNEARVCLGARVGSVVYHYKFKLKECKQTFFSIEENIKMKEQMK